MPSAQARVLVLVDEIGPARVTALADADESSQPSMTTAVQRLEGLGLVARTPDPADARATLVTLTAAGAERIAGIRRSRGAALAPVVERAAVDETRLRDAVVVLGELLEATRPASDPS
ncbi:MarR family transcriptional regulator [Janibacter melonis]|nr:MarR family transcriptional regulator [Janibacter melonis]